MSGSLGDEMIPDEVVDGDEAADELSDAAASEGAPLPPPKDKRREKMMMMMMMMR
jgi:hypothetical protein